MINHQKKKRSQIDSEKVLIRATAERRTSLVKTTRLVFT